MAVPATSKLSYKITANVSYSCPTTRSQDLAEHDFGFSNSSCENRRNVSDTATYVLPSGPQISSAGITSWRYASGIDQRNNPQITVTYTPTTVTAAGWLDTATCICVPIAGCHLDHDTHWLVGVIPTATYIESVQQVAAPISTTTEASIPVTTANLSIPTACNAQSAHNLSFTVTPELNGVAQQGYSSPVFTGDEKGVDSNPIPFGALTLEGIWNPNPVGGNSSVSVTITQNACGY